jgi:hypothetical protein
VGHALSCLGLGRVWLNGKRLSICILLSGIVISEVQDSLELLLNTLIELFGFSRLLRKSDRSGLGLWMGQRGSYVRFNIIMVNLLGQGSRGGVKEGDIGGDIL